MQKLGDSKISSPPFKDPKIIRKNVSFVCCGSFQQGVLWTSCDLLWIVFWLRAGIHKLKRQTNVAFQLPLGPSICSPKYCLWLHPHTAAKGSAMTEATGPTNINCIMWPSSEKHARPTPLEPLNIERQNQLLASDNIWISHNLYYFPYICLICQKMYDLKQKYKGRENKSENYSL